MSTWDHYLYKFEQHLLKRFVIICLGLIQASFLYAKQSTQRLTFQTQTEDPPSKTVQQQRKNLSDSYIHFHLYLLCTNILFILLDEEIESVKRSQFLLLSVKCTLLILVCKGFFGQTISTCFQQIQQSFLIVQRYLLDIKYLQSMPIVSG